MGSKGGCFFKISAHAFMTSERELSVLLSLSQRDKKKKEEQMRTGNEAPNDALRAPAG